MEIKFALIGAAGFIAPRHMNAIKQTKNVIITALDKFDSVGILDSYFPDADFFTEFERFDRHIEKIKGTSKSIDYISICSPNYFHDSHIRFGLRHNCNVICEKPIVLNPWNLDIIEKIKNQTNKKIFNILQLRLHPSIIKLKEKINNSPNKIHDLDLTYITSRGKWYYASWKGDKEKSGGISTNIGIHFFDALSWIFGDLKKNIVHVHSHDRAAGYLEFKNARVRWFLSINYDNLPEKEKNNGLRTFREIKIDGENFEFSSGFTDLHTKSYEEIISGNGFEISDAAPSIEIAYDIRNSKPVGFKGDYHPLAKLNLSNHPFKIKSYENK